MIFQNLEKKKKKNEIDCKLHPKSKNHQQLKKMEGRHKKGKRYLPDPLVQAMRNGEMGKFQKFKKILLLTDKTLRNLHKYFHIAIRNGQKDFVSYLLNDFPSFNPAGHKNAALYLACVKEEVDIVSILLEDNRINLFNEDHSKEDHRCFYIVAEKGYIEIMKVLIDDGRIDHIRGIDVIRFIRRASECGNPDIVSLLWGHKMLASSPNDGVRVYLVDEWCWDHTNFKWYRKEFQRRIIILLIILKRLEPAIKIPKGIKSLLVSMLIKTEVGVLKPKKGEDEEDFTKKNKISPDF